MRKSLFGAILVATLITVGAGCSKPPAAEPEPTYPGYEAPNPAGGTQLEGTPPVNDTPDADINVEGSGETSGTPPAQAAETGEVKSFTVTGDNFAFDLKEIKVKKGDKVRITFKNAEGFHDLKLDEFSIATAKLQAGGEETVEFTADKAGTFEYYCSVGKHRAMGMVGNLIVE